MFFSDTAFNIPQHSHTIFAQDKGHDIPVLNFISGEGPALPEEALDAMIKNVASVLNGKEPVNEVDMQAMETGWEQQSTGLRLFVRHGGPQAGRSSVYMMFSHGCPADLVRHVFNCLASGGMGKVLQHIH